jgi:outer membrane protein OmpA-like peptidoglycan-associated protein
VNRRFSQKNPDTVKLMLSNYFLALKKYQEAPELLRKDVTAETGLPEKTVETMLKGVRWVNLTQNCEQWFGIAPLGGRAEEGLRTAIESAVTVLAHAGDFAENPLPDGDPYRLTYGAYLEELFVKGIAGFTRPASVPGPGTFGQGHQAKFAPLSDGEWEKLKELGTLRVDPIVFQHGEATLDLLGKEVIDKAVQLLAHYPNFRVVVRGHTGAKGDPDANLRLSQERAESVARYLTVTHNIDPNRIRAIGYGGTRPLPKLEEESVRAWQYRLPRVELVLVREEY